MSFNEADHEDIFNVLFIPKQKQPHPDLLADKMGVHLSSYPPLSQVTQLRDENVPIHVVLEVPKDRVDEPWQVALWHSETGNEWGDVVLSSDEGNYRPSHLQHHDGSSSRIHLAGSIMVKGTLQFTFRYRNGPDQPWTWVRDAQGLGDGTVIVSSRSSEGNCPEELSDIIKDLNQDLTVKSIMSQCPGTSLWSVEIPLAAAEGDEPTLSTTRLGTPWGDSIRWFALVRLWTPWIAPRQGKSKFELDKDAITCSFLNPEGRHVVLLAISGLDNVVTVFRSGEAGQVLVHAQNDDLEKRSATVYAAVGSDFESANAAVMYQARSTVTEGQRSSHELQSEIRSLARGIEPQWMENWYDGLGYCTWNALGQDLTEEKVLGAVDSLAKNGINVTTFIIDDNWQSIDYRGHGQFQHGWVEFEANRKGFPSGLKGTVSQLRQRLESIQHVAVWHALLGYWGGLAPDGKIAQTYRTVEVAREDAERRNLPLGGKMTVVAREDVDRLYGDFYAFLAGAGVDSVKTDAQFMVDTWTSARARRELTHAYQDAWTIASLRHLSARAVSCMSQTPQLLFYSQLPRGRPAVPVRNSDDFFPDVAQSHPWHLFTNAHAALFTQHLNVLPDWDMFQTVHDYSAFHAAARCLSGGPIYITDAPGEHDLDLIGQMTGTTTRGKTVIFRPSVLGKSIDQYVGYHDEVLLKIGCYHGRAATGTPMLGVFNVSARPLKELIPLARFPGVLPSLRYVVRAHSSGRMTEPTRAVPDHHRPAALLAVALDVRGHDVLAAHPLATFAGEARGGGGAVHVANLGLLGKLTGAAAVVASDAALLPSGRVFVDTKLKALGVLGIYISVLPNLTIEGDFMITILGQPVPPHTVSVNKEDEHVLDIDIETAWREMGLSSGWSNEVQVKVYFSIE